MENGKKKYLEIKLNQKQLKQCRFEEEKNEKKNKAKTSSFSWNLIMNSL